MTSVLVGLRIWDSIFVALAVPFLFLRAARAQISLARLVQDYSFDYIEMAADRTTTPITTQRCVVNHRSKYSRLVSLGYRPTAWGPCIERSRQKKIDRPWAKKKFNNNELNFELCLTKFTSTPTMSPPFFSYTLTVYTPCHLQIVLINICQSSQSIKLRMIFSCPTTEVRLFWFTPGKRAGRQCNRSVVIFVVHACNIPWPLGLKLEYLQITSPASWVWWFLWCTHTHCGDFCGVTVVVRARSHRNTVQ